MEQYHLRSNLCRRTLSKSSQNPRLILTPPTRESCRMLYYRMSSIVSFPVHPLLENQSSTISGDTCHGWLNTVDVVGTYYGLLCLLFRVCQNYWFRLWNPATRTISEELGIFHDNNALSGNFKFNFGCDISAGTYKVVAYRIDQDEENYSSWRSQVQLFSISDNCWRDIESFPLIPINRNNNGVHLSGTINWLALSNYHHSLYYYELITYIEQFGIVSLDLSTETYTQFLLPPGFDKVPRIQPTLVILLDCLCFSHDFKRTEIVIWQMKEFGVQESWTQLFKIDYFILQMNILPLVINMEFLSYIDCNTPLLPLYLSKNGDTLILANYEDDQAIIYNGRDKSVDRIRISNTLCWFSSMNYVESSLVSPL
ncbi:hypothetical protein TSUD_163080 [Trifolium subterraneum]|uniref:Uncharacterized protein n=1 Tax=Trifolium subterraneum TaxID=3900 RepID=A0A2Z6P8D7_TRISU|nr:hypothetical protein TSUD_163080 [Trifolium subterraneum]